MFSFYKKRAVVRKPIVPLTDIHAHLLPGIDDGPKSMVESIRMIEKMQALGYTRLTATPHVFYDYYPNTKQEILAVYQNLCEKLETKGINIQVDIAAEYYLDEHFSELLQDRELLTLLDGKVLIEVSTLGKPYNMDKLIWDIIVKGYQPLLAHPERYLYMADEDYLRLLSYGCQFQINLLSLNGHYGPAVKKRVLKLLKNNWVHYIGTDAHRPSHVDLANNVLNTAFYQSIDLSAAPANARVRLC